MAKQVRFTQLVKASGRPYSASLWVSDPAQDPEFKKAIADNRIITIYHVNIGGRKESGEIGFTKGGGAAYLIFPKALPFAPGTRVVGIKYRELEDRYVKDPVTVTPASRRTPIQKVKIVAPEPEAKEKGSLDQKSAKVPPKATLKSKDQIKQLQDRTGPATFQLTLELTARQVREVKVQATTVAEAIEIALDRVRKDPPEADWTTEATMVKRIEK